MRLNTKRKLIDEIQEEMQELDVKHKISIKPKAIQKKQKQSKFMEIAFDIMAKKGLGNQEKASIKRKESIANQMTETISSLDHEFEVDVKVVLPKKTRGRSGRILDGTQLIKEIVKQQKDKDGSRPINQKYKSQKKSKNKLHRSKQSRDDLFKQLKKCQLKKKSSELTSQQIRQTFQKTSLEDMVIYKKIDDKGQSTKLLHLKKQDEIKIPSENQEKSDQQSVNYLSQSFDSCSNSLDSSVDQSHKSLLKRKKQKFKRIKPKCTFIEQQAEQSGSDISSGQESEEQENSLKDLINNEIVLDEKNEAQAVKKRLQLEAADDLAIIQKIYKGQLFKKRSLPQLLPSEKVRQLRQNQQKQKYSKQLQELLEKPKIVQQNILAEAPRTSTYIDYALEQQKQVFQNEQYFQKNRQKSRTHVEKPTFLIKKSTTQMISRPSKYDQQQIKLIDNKKKRGSLIDPKKLTKPPTTTALGEKIILANMFWKDQSAFDA